MDELREEKNVGGPGRHRQSMTRNTDLILSPKRTANGTYHMYLLCRDPTSALQKIKSSAVADKIFYLLLKTLIEDLLHISITVAGKE
jgi:hypothetical protein